MCIGIPMQVVSVSEGSSVCEGMGERKEVDTLLVGDQPEGTWLLVFLNAAREVLTPEAANQIQQALEALNLAMQGNTSIDHLFADLVDREPELPEHLRSPR